MKSGYQIPEKGKRTLQKNNYIQDDLEPEKRGNSGYDHNKKSENVYEAREDSNKDYGRGFYKQPSHGISERRNKSNINYSPQKDVIQEKIGNYNSIRRFKQLQSPYATGGHFASDEKKKPETKNFEDYEKKNKNFDNYEKRNFESSQIDKKENLTDYTLPESSNYYPKYRPRATRIE